MHESNRSFVIFGVGLDIRLWPGTCTCSDTRGSALGFGSHRYNYCLSSSVEFKIATDEFIVGAFILKENYLTERLTSRLEAN